MIFPHAGEFAALGTAVCWTVTMMAFESAGRRVGSLVVNLTRLFIGFAYLSVFAWLTRGLPFPTDADAHAWFWLTLSGLVGFVIGDLALFRSLLVLGARVAMLMMSLVPPMTALFGWLVLGETLHALDWIGMALTLFGVSLVIFERREDENGKRLFSFPVFGIFLGLVAAFGQAAGLVLSKFGMGDYNAFAATQIRLLAGIVGFSIMFIFIGWWPKVIAGLSDRKALRITAFGAFFGPFLGVSLSLLSVQLTVTGVAATIMSITPVLIIPPAVLIFHEKISARSIAGAVLAVIGVALLFL